MASSRRTGSQAAVSAFARCLQSNGGVLTLDLRLRHWIHAFETHLLLPALRSVAASLPSEGDRSALGTIRRIAFEGELEAMTIYGQDAL